MSHASLSLSLPQCWMDKLWLYKNSLHTFPYKPSAPQTHPLTRSLKHADMHFYNPAMDAHWLPTLSMMMTPGQRHVNISCQINTTSSATAIICPRTFQPHSPTFDLIIVVYKYM